MKRLLSFSLILAAMVLPAFSAGLIVVHDTDFWRHPHPPLHPPPHRPPVVPPPHHPPRIIPRPSWAPLEVAYHKVEAKIKNQAARTSVEQEFYNPNARQMEGTFLFPVPKGAHIDQFSMEIDGKPVEAELLAADKARGIYEDIVRKLNDPALLEYMGRDLFKVRIFPIEPHGRKRIHLSYAQVLPSDSGLVEFTLPLSTEKFSAKPLKSLSVKVEIESDRALKSIYSPSHKVEVQRHGEDKATVGFEESNLTPDTDFKLIFSREEGEFGVSLLPHTTGDEEGHFLLLVSPSAELKSGKVIPKDVAFVLDTSGSMAGAKLEQAKKALLFCIENLNESDRFEIVRFATEVEPLFNGLTDVSRENRDRAGRFIKALKPLGGTAINDALKGALHLRPEKGERPFVVIFLTDGRPTVGVTSLDDIVKNVTRTDQVTRVFCFGIGTDVNTHLLDRITEETRAFSQYVLPEEDIEIKVSTFFTRIKEPVLANPKITFPDGVRVRQLYPSPLPDLFKGQQLVLAGRYSGSGAGRLTIEGNVAGEQKEFSYEIKFPAQSSDHEFVPRLWATRRVGYLLDEIRLRGESKELKDEVTELARKFNIVTPYTAYLIVEDERRRDVPAAMRSLGGLEQNERWRREAPLFFDRLGAQQSGDEAVAGARFSYELKTAETAANAVRSANTELGRVTTAPLASSTPAPAGGVTLAEPRGALGGAVQADKAQAQYGGQSRFAGGRSFFFNGTHWIDAEAQKLGDARPIRIEFGSSDYFDLLARHPEAASWLALGQNVRFVLDAKVYEIHE